MFRHNHTIIGEYMPSLKRLTVIWVLYEFHNHQIIVLLKPYCVWIKYMHFLVYDVIYRTVRTHLHVGYVIYQM